MPPAEQAPANDGGGEEDGGMGMGRMMFQMMIFSMFISSMMSKSSTPETTPSPPPATLHAEFADIPDMDSEADGRRGRKLADFVSPPDADAGGGPMLSADPPRPLRQLDTLAMPSERKPRADAPVAQQGGGGKVQPQGLRNLYSTAASVECDLFVHVTSNKRNPKVAAVVDEQLGASQGLHRLWHQRVWYAAEATKHEVNVSLPPLDGRALRGEEQAFPRLLATLLRRPLGDDVQRIPDEQVIMHSLPLVQLLRELPKDMQTDSLFGGEPDVALANLSASAKIPYFKTKVEIRPVYDHTVHNMQTLRTGPFKKIVPLPQLGVYQPFVYVSDFWLLEKDYLALNSTLSATPLNLTLSYSVITMMAWSMQTQMGEQWMVQGDWGLTDTQKDSFMVKRLMIDTNPYLLAFSGAFILLHTLFGILAFKNDIQFWRNNESMQGLSARSMIVSWVCQVITCFYLLDSQQTSRLILFEIFLDMALATWKLRKAVKIELKASWPFVGLGGQKGYEDNATSTYDDIAVRYMMSILFPAFIGYAIRSMLYEKHRGWLSFLIGTLAGGVYTFGFIMMTPQLYINYRLQSVEHLPWRALTYKAMNTFVDDIAALLVDMPMMHRVSCFRDDIIFFVMIYQRWKYRVDKTRPSIYANPPSEQAAAAEAAKVADADAAPADAGVAATAVE